MIPVAARPFLKWAGGKRNLVPVILKVFPLNFKSYFEPFLGGGALFFAVANKIENAYLSDTNSDLVQTYKVVRDQTDEVIEQLREHQASHSAAHFTLVRNQYDLSDPVEAAARFIYLNKTCFNGLYRVNRKGRFNVPMGKYKNPLICDEQNLKIVARTLQETKIQKRDFGRIKPGLGDVIYCDPPYDGTFTSYTEDGFGFKEQVRLRNCCYEWQLAGAHVVLSNSDTPAIRDLYSESKIIEVQGKRSINSLGTGRGEEQELLVII